MSLSVELGAKELPHLAPTPPLSLQVPSHPGLQFLARAGLVTLCVLVSLSRQGVQARSTSRGHHLPTQCAGDTFPLSQPGGMRRTCRQAGRPQRAACVLVSLNRQGVQARSTSTMFTTAHLRRGSSPHEDSLRQGWLVEGWPPQRNKGRVQPKVGCI